VTDTNPKDALASFRFAGHEKELSMKLSMLIGVLTLGAGLAGVSTPAHAEGRIAGRWQGVLLRDGLQVPMSMELSGADRELSGQLRLADRFASVQSASSTLTGVHFEVPGAGVFDGTVAGDSMAGRVSGASAAGSFSLVRESDSPFGDAITSSGP
jgi:hypothetical protein